MNSSVHGRAVKQIADVRFTKEQVFPDFIAAKRTLDEAGRLDFGLLDFAVRLIL